MSFDLFFCARRGTKAPSQKALRSYFEGRGNYQVSASQALYENQDTGVYFSFDFQAEKGKKRASAWVPLAFNVNYYRPHVFGLEADLELGEFVRAFDLLVSDPQNEGMGDGEYSSEGFLRGWNTGNRFAYHAILNSSEGRPESLDAMPAAWIERCWRWNIRRKELQAKKEETFVPSIMVLRHQGKLATVACWPDAIPVVLPRVDLLLLGRDELIPSEQRREGQPDMALVTWEAFERVRVGRQVLKGRDDCVVMAYKAAPESFVKFFLDAESVGKLEGVPLDQILDAELVQECLSRRKESRRREVP
jgi:hypothetical protein